MRFIKLEYSWEGGPWGHDREIQTMHEKLISTWYAGEDSTRREAIVRSVARLVDGEVLGSELSCRAAR